jgi:hypothetical protein
MPLPKEPIIFLKATSCIQGANDDVMLPKGSVKSDLGSRTRYRNWYQSLLCQPKGCFELCRRLLHRQRCERA